MNKAEINKKLEDGILDLWSRDLEELVVAKRYREALSVGIHLGIPKEEITKIIQEYKNGIQHNEKK